MYTYVLLIAYSVSNKHKVRLYLFFLFSNYTAKIAINILKIKESYCFGSNVKLFRFMV